MVLNFISTPPKNAKPDILVDWLEFVAFFDQFGRSRVDEVTASNRVQLEEPPEDIGEADQIDDRLRESVENEVEERKKALQQAYPFSLDENAEELQFLGAWDEPSSSFYLLCLIASHVSGSAIVSVHPSSKLIDRMRNRVFQVLGTLAVAGLARGPAVSIGYPRETKEKILDVLRRAERWGFGLAPRDKPGRHATPRAKDGGVDVIGWPHADRPPPATVWFGQIASGQNWEGKPTKTEYDNFMNDFFEDRGTDQHNFLTLVPFRLFDNIHFQRQSNVHKYLCDRFRAPFYALTALTLHNSGTNIDEAQNVGQIIEWIRDYRQSVVVD